MSSSMVSGPVRAAVSTAPAGMRRGRGNRNVPPSPAISSTRVAVPTPFARPAGFRELCIVRPVRLATTTLNAYFGDVAEEKSLFTWTLEQERDNDIDNDLIVVINSIATACKSISNLVAEAPLAGNTGSAGGAMNQSGDEQKKLDVIANDVFTAAVKTTGRTGIIATEEEDNPIVVEAVMGGDYIVCFDPIDGSSNIDASVSTGSIFGIYSAGECVLSDEDGPEEMMDKCLLNVQQAGTELVAAGYCMYSSSCVMVLSLGSGVYGFTLDPLTKEFVLSHDDLKIPDPGQRIYSGNEGNTSLWAPELKEYVDTLKAPEDGSDPYSYRYIGALVGDFHRTLLYGGIWLYPPDIKAPQGKARLLYEVAPMSFLAEQAGGMSTWGPMADQRVLEVVPKAVHQKSPMFVGSTSEVTKLQDFLKKKASVAA